MFSIWLFVWTLLQNMTYNLWDIYSCKICCIAFFEKDHCIYNHTPTTDSVHHYQQHCWLDDYLRCTRIANRTPCLHTANALFWHQRTKAAEYFNHAFGEFKEKVSANSTVFNLIIISVWKISFKVKWFKNKFNVDDKTVSYGYFIKNNTIVENYVVSIVGLY